MSLSLFRISEKLEQEPDETLIRVADAWEAAREEYEATGTQIRNILGRHVGYCGPGSYTLARLAQIETGRPIRAGIDEEPINHGEVNLIFGLHRRGGMFKDHAWVEVREDEQILLANPLSSSDSLHTTFETEIFPAEELPMHYRKRGLRRTNLEELANPPEDVTDDLKGHIGAVCNLLHQINEGRTPYDYRGNILQRVVVYEEEI